MRIGLRDKVVVPVPRDVWCFPRAFQVAQLLARAGIRSRALRRTLQFYARDQAFHRGSPLRVEFVRFTGDTFSMFDLLQPPPDRTAILLRVLARGLPPRIAEEEIGDALEFRERGLAAGLPLWELRLGVAAKVFWALVHTLGHFLKSVTGR